MAEQIELRLNPNAQHEAKAAILSAVRDTFVFDIKPKAQELSPVTDAGLRYNREKHPAATLTQIGGTGTNRRSIDVEVKEDVKGVKAELYTQSGYGGWLEIGTRFMRAQPYLWPAFRAFQGKIAERVKVLIGNR
jgi:HK97 gp10 family phage protein